MAERIRGLPSNPSDPDVLCRSARSFRRHEDEEHCNQMMVEYREILDQREKHLLNRGITLPAVCQ